MDPRVGFVTQVEMGLADAVAAGERYDFDYLEVMLDGSEARSRIEDPDRVRQRFDDAGLDRLVHLPFGGIDAGSPFEHVREGAVAELTAHLELAADVGAEKAVLHADSDAWPPAWDDEARRQAVVASIRELREVGADLGVEVCPENLPGGITSVHGFPELFERTEADMTLDTGHARVDGLGSAGIAAFVAEHADRISHVHLNDTRIPEDEHLPFGAGNLDFEAILGAFPADWDGTLSLEVFTADYEYVGVSTERLDRVLDGL